jgi:hypothetical protein
MQIDPVQEWRRLTEHYRSMSDEQLRELAFDFADLTEMAQQVLRDELRLRRINGPLTREEQSKFVAKRAEILQPSAGFEEASADTDEAEEDDGLPHHYTWKTQLCECENDEQAWQLSEMLHRAGIDSWVEDPRSDGLVYCRILVAADQLDEARAVADRPIPQDVIDESKQTIPEFVVPACPTCGAEDPLLESVDPVNTWRCEFCGREWTDPAAKPTGASS